MANHTDGLHHKLVRKKIHKKEVQINKWKRLLDRVIYPIGVLGPILTIPQLLEIWVEKNASGVSLFTWSSWVFIASFWLIYGIAHKETPIIISYIGWLTIEIGVVVGVIIYG